MKVIIVENKEEMGKVAADIIANDIKSKAHYVLGLATGSTPETTYQELINKCKAGELTFKRVITFNLDEYVGLPVDHPESYRRFMNEKLFNHVDIDIESTHVPNGLADDIEAFCEEYEEMIEDVGGVDLQVLGIGSNGHIGFNEPGTSLASRTHMVKLTENTRRDNSRFFDNDINQVPTHAITMGIGTILDARKVVLVANGENKADAIAKAIEGPITATVPASALQLHPDVTFVVTRDAASKLQLEWE